MWFVCVFQLSARRYTLPLTELAGDFYDNLKGCTSGYATFEYVKPTLSTHLAILPFPFAVRS